LNVLRYFPTQAMNFCLKDFYKLLFNPYKQNDNPNLFFLGNVLSGGAAGATSLTIMYPFEFVRTWLAMDIGRDIKDWEFKGIFDVIAKIRKSDGVVGFYRGFFIAVWGIGLYRASYFGLFDTFRPKLFGHGEGSFIGLWMFA